MQWNAHPTLAQGCLDCLCDPVDTSVLAAVRFAEFSLLLRSRQSLDCCRSLAGKSADIFLASQRPAVVPDLVHRRSCRALVSRRHLIGGTEYMFDSHIPLAIRLLSLFHVVTPPLLLWAIWRVGYDPRGWKYQTLTAWIVIPINYFWRPQYDVNWARGPFFHEQHVVPGLLYLLAYLTIVPAAVYFPTHRFLLWLTRRAKP